MAPDLSMRWQDQNIVKKDGRWTVDGRPGPSVDVIAHHSPSNMPNHYYIGFRITSPPNSATPPHTHGGAAVVATLLKGRMVNQVVCPEHDPDSQGSGAEIIETGQSWHEPPGCHHVRSENPFDEEAEFVTWLVADREYVDREGPMGLLVIDAAVEEEQGKR